ncbi:MAG: polysaccharide biosynthesis C-terminal domain-containing protein [Planctomycetes bacterium]|nr:polysaccharide biosynthesis C-terminal domain-containing protein [Planctomycetota bacterium]
MLRKLLAYSAFAFVIQLVTGMLTKVVELFFVADRLDSEELGGYRHFLLVLEVCSGLFVVGMDHSLVTFINAKAGRPALFLRLFLVYGLLITAVFGAGAALAAGRVDAPTYLALVTVGPFVFFELGKVVFRAKLEKGLEFGFLLFQSLAWSLGCLAILPFWNDPMVPIWCTLLGIIPGACVMARVFVRRARQDGGPALTAQPFGDEYRELWSNWRPLWIAGLAFLANTHVVNLVVDAKMSREDFGRWSFVLIALTLLHRPVMIVQRATLPIFTAQKEEIPDGFRKLVRLNLVFFPLLSIGVLTVWPLVLRYGTLGEKFGDSWLYLSIPVAVIPVMAVEFLVATSSMALGFPRNNRNAHVVTALVNVPVSWFLILRFGLLGASLSAAFYVVFFAATILRFARHDLPELVKFATRRMVLALLGLWVAVALLGWSGRPEVWGWLAMPAFVAWGRVAGLWEPQHLRWAMERLRKR